MVALRHRKNETTRENRPGDWWFSIREGGLALADPKIWYSTGTGTVGTLRIACYLLLDNHRDNLPICFLFCYYFRL